METGKNSGQLEQSINAHADRWKKEHFPDIYHLMGWDRWLSVVGLQLHINYTAYQLLNQRREGGGRTSSGDQARWQSVSQSTQPMDFALSVPSAHGKNDRLWQNCTSTSSQVGHHFLILPVQHITFYPLLFGLPTRDCLTVRVPGHFSSGDIKGWEYKKQYWQCSAEVPLTWFQMPP